MDNKRKILIVDDEPLNLDFFEIMLSNLGFDVDKAMDGEEALDKVKIKKPDLIILDNIMPKLTGWEVTRILKKDEEYKAYRNIPVVMFSAMDDVKDKIEGYELGVEDYITKPFNFSEVLARIRAVLRHHELSKKLLRKERKIAHVESMNQSLVYFTQHLRQPVLDLLDKSEKVKQDDMKMVNEYVAAVRKECEQVLATLDGLEEEIAELKTKKVDLDRGDHILEELEAKFTSKFEAWKKKQGDLNEVIS